MKTTSGLMDTNCSVIFDTLRTAKAALLVGPGVTSAMTAGAGSLIETTPFYEGDTSVYTGRIEDRVNLWPLVYYREPMFSALWPLVSVSHDHLAVRPFFSYDRDGSETRILWPLVTLGEEEGHVFTWCWNKHENGCLPFYYYSSSGDSTHWWALPGFYYDSDGIYGWFPLFHRNSQTNGTATTYGLCGLAGWRNRNGELDDHWCLPFYGHSRDGHETTTWYACGLAGKRESDDGKSSKSWCLPLYGHETDANGSHSTKLACGLAGWEGKDGETSKRWCFPFYGYDATDSHAVSTWYACGLFSFRKDKAFEPVRTAMETASQSGLAAVDASAPGEPSRQIRSKSAQIFPLFRETWDVRDFAGVKTNGGEERQFALEHTRGTPLFYSVQEDQRVCFDEKTQEKVKDERYYKKSLWDILYHAEGKEDRLTGKSEETCSVLWRLYHAQRHDGDTSVDVFPGFTRDTRTDGYTRTSFLWRFFRYESDPAAGTTKLDLCFLPVKR
ncbi:MAG: hypothetical protein J6U40_13830 [Kiritimatiellae bacterium]|nr:hypothetical protein [Kiritimatiellia bacterium]